MQLAQFRVYAVASCVAGVFALGGAAAQGQRPQGGGPAGGPMLVDFIAVTADGKAVTELAPADVSIKVGGKTRTISELTLKRSAPPAGAAVAAPAAAPAPATSGPSAPYFTNDPAAAPTPPPPAAAGGRAFLIVVDTESLAAGTEPQIKTAIEGLLKELTPADRVAFSIAPHDSAQLPFGPVGAARAAVANLRGQKAANASSTDALCRTSDTLNLLKGRMAQATGGETPTAVIVIAASLSTPSSSSSTSGGTCTVTPDQYNSMATATSAARVNMYVVQGDPGAMGRDSGLENLAGVTGAGAVMRVVNDGFAPRVLADASAYWVATLAPDASDRPGQSQRLEVKAVKSDLTIRTRPEVMMARAAAPAGGAPAADPKGGAAKTPKDMLASTAPFTDLQLRAYAVTQRGAGDKMNVLVWAEPVDPAVKIAAMRVGFFDASNKGPSLDAPQVATYPIATLLPVAAGQYRIRVAATDASGKSGAVDVKIDTTFVTAGPFKLSGLMLLNKSADGKMSPRLEFSKGDTISAMFELYGIVPPAAEMIIGFEVAATDTGQFMKTYKPTGSATTNEPDKVQVYGDIPVADLPPGDYVIRAVVQLKDNPMGKTIRTLRIK